MQKEMIDVKLKNKILYELELNRGRDLSGQLLADKFGVSRNAVWKAIKALKKDGYEISSSTNKGYRLEEDCDALSAEGINSYLSDEYKNLEVFYFNGIDSTNNEAKRMLANGYKKVALVVSDYQSEGRGRNGKHFYSPGRTGIYLTLIIHPQKNVGDFVSVTTAAAVAVIRAIKVLTDKKPKIKWVNDIYLQNRKIGGILTEAITDFESGTVHSVVVGIGINVNTVNFPDDIKDIASSLKPSNLTRNKLAAEIVNQLLKIIDNLSDNLFLDEYREHSLVIGRKIKCLTGNSSYYALAEDIDDSGGLVIKKDDGSRAVLRSGEISVRLD